MLTIITSIIFSMTSANPKYNRHIQHYYYYYHYYIMTKSNPKDCETHYRGKGLLNLACFLWVILFICRVS